MRLALIDGDTGFLQVLCNRLNRLDWDWRVFEAPYTAARFVDWRAQALVVDMASLGPEGADAVERICRELPTLPVLVCGVDSTVAERVHVLRMGADDWIAKPCHPEELIARVEAAVRRGRATAAAAELEPMAFGDLEIRPARYQAFAGERSLELTRREYELLVLLAEADGRVLEREHIYERVWGYRMVRGDRSVDVFVRKLRQKLRRGSPGWEYLHTHFGVGYRFSAEPVSAPCASPPRPTTPSAPR
ncbi:MAG TPA: response regulator transcription factor [Solirubrobacteraceae bacterium]|nr:response regulator transcription factor [Solirubrobacteraceae bacterium]